MRSLTSKRRQSYLLTALVMIGAVVACNLPLSSQKGKNLSQEEALELVLEEIVQPDQLGDDPLVVFAWSEALRSGDVLHPYNILGEDPVPGLIEIKSESWFFWIEDEPYAQFGHPTRFVLIDIKSGEISTTEERWWPVLNGQGLWTDTAEYKNEENWAWSNVSFMEDGGSSSNVSSSVLASRIPSQIELLTTEDGSRRALVINTTTEDQLGEDNSAEDAASMLGVLGKNDFETTYLGTEYDNNSNRAGVPFTPGKAGGTDPWEEELRKQADEMKPGDTLVVYIAGHGDASRLGGGYISNENGEILSYELEEELGKFDPGVDVIVILQGCNTGAWINDLKDVADLTMTATDADTSSYGDMDFVTSWISPLFLTDLNPLDDGSEYTSSLVSGWETILDDPELLEEVKERAEDEGISFMQALISEAYEEGSIYDMAARLQLSHPQVSYGSKKATPTPSPTPTSTPTPEPSPTSSYGYTLGDYRVSMAVKKDPSGHKGFINMPGNTKLTLKEGSIQIDGPFPWVAVIGELSPDGSIDATGRGTVAGYQNINVTFQGRVSGGQLVGDYTMGANGGLPGGQSIVYGVSGDRQEPTSTPTPDPRIGELQEFFNIYNARFQAADVDSLLTLLHPEVLDLYGFDACQEYLSTVVDKPIEIKVIQVVSYEPWTWNIDGHTSLIEDAYSIQVEVTAEGQTVQQTMHLGLADDGTIAWFTDCGEPLP